MSKPRIIIELCCGSADDVFIGRDAGVERVELNSAMFLGGLTPSIGEVRGAVRSGVKVIAMIRPREGGFCYSPGEFEVMLEDTAAIGEAGAAGIAFGILLPDGTVDEERCGKLIEAARPMEAVFHRAFDVVPDWRAAMDSLRGLGAVRILSSGQAPSAERGSDVIRRMREYAAGRIGILPGGGINLQNVRSLVEKTGCTEIHVSMRKAGSDPSCAANPDIHFGSPLYLPEDRYQRSDGEALGALVSLLN